MRHGDVKSANAFGKDLLSAGVTTDLQFVRDAMSVKLGKAKGKEMRHMPVSHRTQPFTE